MLRYYTSGESHGETLVAFLSGMPAGLGIDLSFIDRELWRRQQGFGRGGRMRIERDTAHIVSGVRQGKTIGALARERGQHPWDTFLDFGLDDELDAMLDCRLFNIDEDQVRRLLRHPNAAVALSDAGAHLSFLCDAGFGLHLFGHWVRERGDLTLEQAVRAVTNLVQCLHGGTDYIQANRF